MNDGTENDLESTHTESHRYRSQLLLCVCAQHVGVKVIYVFSILPNGRLVFSIIVSFDSIFHLLFLFNVYSFVLPAPIIFTIVLDLIRPFSLSVSIFWIWFRIFFACCLATALPLR